MIPQKHDTLPQLKAVAESTEIRPGQILISGKPPIPFYEGSGQYPSDLPARLSEAIYRHLYSVGALSGEEWELPAGQLVYDDALAFVRQLEKANATAPRLDKGWKVEEDISGGQALTVKGNFKRTLHPGEYVFSNSLLYAPDEKRVSLWMPKQDVPADKGFYYAFGSTAGEENGSMQVRFYFNLLPEGAPLLLNWLTATFNRAAVPFQFKCLHHPALYGRSDAGVLYLSKRYAGYAAALLDDFVPELSPHLRAPTPLFTLPLYPGIAFAESPPLSSASFGTSRCDIIAAGLSAAYEKGLSDEKKLEEVLLAIQHQNLDPSRLFLNPNSHYPYPFLKNQAA